MASAQPGAYNARILRPLGGYIQERKGLDALEQICRSTGLTPQLLDGRTHWISTKQFEAVLIGARSLLSSDEEFMEACAHKLAESYGPLRFLLRAMSPGAVFKQSIKTYQLVSTVGQHEIVSATRTSMVVRWTASPVPHRLVCLCKQAQSAGLPTVWGLPAARIEEVTCMSRGDAQCELHGSWFESPSWIPTLATLLIGAFLAFLVNRYLRVDLLIGLTMAGLMSSVTHLRELYATNRVNRDAEQQMTEALQNVIDQESQARQELWELHKSQRDWNRMLEQESQDRTVALRSLSEHFEQIEQSRSEIFRGYSHDLRNPLQVMRLGTGYLRHALASDEKAKQVIDELDWSVSQMNDLLTQLNKMAQQPVAATQLSPRLLELSELTERLRRRSRALVYGREIKTTVFSTREAPPQIHLDPVLFDRVMDNLLTNAVKYTERGSIVVELDGSPGFLVVKISDTGRGISPEDLVRTFAPGGSDEGKRAEHSLGVGLSVVVQLLGQIGGRLEVMSKPAVGTTFWIHFPSQLEQVAVVAATESYERVLERVVSIRRAN